MIGTIEVKCQAARPHMPLTPMFAFKNSPSSLRVLDVPKSIGTWNINTVKVVVNYPNNETIIKNAVRNGSVWVATFEGCDVVGKVANGYEVVADGVDENGNDVPGYVLGAGDVFIIDGNPEVTPSDSRFYVRYCPEVPEVPMKGDCIVVEGEDGTTLVKIYDGTEWKNQTLFTKTSELINDSGFITSAAIPSNVSDFNNDAGYITASAIPTNVGAFTNDVGYLTASSTEFKNKRDYDDQTFTMPSDVTLVPFVNGYDYQRWARAYVQKFDVTYDGVEHELNEFIINPEYGMMWYKASTLFMATIDGQTFYLRDNNTNIMATTTISALKSGVVDFTYDGKSGSISMTAREKTNLALDYQTITGNLVVNANGTTVGLYNPKNPIGGAINIPVPSNVSQLNNDAGYVTASSSSFTNKRDYIDLTYTTTSHPHDSDTSELKRWVKSVFEKFTLTVTGHDPDEYVFQSYQAMPDRGMRWNCVDFGYITTTDGVYYYLYVNGTQVKALRLDEILAGSVTFSLTLDGSAYQASILLTTNDTINIALEYQTLNGKLYIKKNGNLIGTYDPANIIGTEINVTVPTNISELNNDSGYITASAIPSNVSDFNNDAGYLTASSAAFMKKRDKSDLSYSGPNVKRINLGITSFTIEFGGDYPGITPVTTTAFQPDNETLGKLWYGNSQYINTTDGTNFKIRDLSNVVYGSFTMSDLVDGDVSLTYTYDNVEYPATLNANFIADELATFSEIPSAVSQLTNDAGYVTASTVSASYYNKTEADALLSAKQDVLDVDELTTISQVTDERKTVITFTDNSSEEYEWVGELSRNNIVDAGLWDVDHGGWIREPLSIKVGAAVNRLGDNAFANAHYLTSIDLPSTVTSIGMYCLYDCQSLTSVVIPYSMKTIGSYTFGYCTSLTSVTIPNSVETIGNSAFEHCESLVSINIPDSVTSIGDRAFQTCTSLANLTIPDSVTSIGNYSFLASGVQNVVIGSGVTSIGEDAFYNASSVASVVFRGKTLTQIQGMTNYPWEISDTSIITTWNDASKEYVDGIVGSINTALDNINGEVI